MRKQQLFFSLINM